MSENYKAALNKARSDDNKSKNPAAGSPQNDPDQAKKITAAVTSGSFFAVIFQISPARDWAYGLATFAAIFKDLIDPIGATVLLYIVVVVATLCISIFIWFMMLLASFSEGQGTGQKQRRKAKAKMAMLKRSLVLISGTTIEFLLGLNFLPWETFTVLIIYGMVLFARKEAKEEEKRERAAERKIPRYAYADDYAEDFAEAA